MEYQIQLTALEAQNTRRLLMARIFSWPMNETESVRNLIRQYGTNWLVIATYMKSKTSDEVYTSSS